MLHLSASSNQSVTSFASEAPLIPSTNPTGSEITPNHKSRLAQAVREIVWVGGDVQSLCESPKIIFKAIKRKTRKELVEMDLLPRPDSSEESDQELDTDIFNKLPRTFRTERALSKYWNRLQTDCKSLLEVTRSLQTNDSVADTQALRDEQAHLIEEFMVKTKDWRLYPGDPRSLGEEPGSRTYDDSIEAFCKAALSERGVMLGVEFRQKAIRFYKEAQTQYEETREEMDTLVSLPGSAVTAGLADEKGDDILEEDDEKDQYEQAGYKYSEKESHNSESRGPTDFTGQ